MKKIAWPELRFPCTHRCNPWGIRMGKGRPFGVLHIHTSAIVLYLLLWGGSIYIFADKSQAIKRYIKQKMSLRTQRSKTICMYGAEVGRSGVRLENGVGFGPKALTILCPQKKLLWVGTPGNPGGCEESERTYIRSEHPYGMSPYLHCQ